jgi:hypothetical protein
MRMRSAAILSGHKRKLGKLEPTPWITEAYGALNRSSLYAASLF